MTATWTKKVKWFKKKPEPRTYDYDWEYTYLNAIGNPVKCIIIDDAGNGFVDILNENGVKVFHIHTTKLQKINKEEGDITE